MAREPRTSPILPSYGESSLADLSTSILAALTGDAARNVLGLPETGRACLLIIDGLGLELLRAHQAAAPFLAELAFNSRPLTSGFPSTTVTSLASLGTGLPPSAARDARLPGRGARHRPAAQRPQLAQGHRPGRLAAPADDLRAGGWRRADRDLRRAHRLREERADHGHAARPAVPRRGLARHPRRADGRRAGRFRQRAGGGLPRRPGLDRAPLRGGLAGLGVPALARQPAGGAARLGAADGDRAVRHGRPRHGERRATTTRSTWTPTARPPCCATGWRCSAASRARGTCTPRPGPPPTSSRPGGRCWASAPGWRPARRRSRTAGSARPGVVDEAMAARIGDVVAACSGTAAVIASKAEPLQSSLFGMHGSLTAAEQLIPMLTIGDRLGRRS